MNVKPGDNLVQMLEMARSCKASLVALVGLSGRELSDKVLEIDDFEG